MKDAKGHGSNPRGGAKGPYKPIPDHPYHQKTDAELHYIAKDAHEAAQAMRGMDDKAEGKYLDQVNDASTVLGYRRRGGQRDVPDKAAADALAQGHPKSGSVPVHAAMGPGTPAWERETARIHEGRRELMRNMTRPKAEEF